MLAEVLRVGAGRVLWDDFAVALARACFEAWTMCTSVRGGMRRGDGDAARATQSATQSATQCAQLAAEVAELRSELVESQQLRALSQAQVKRLERQLATEQEWCLEASRFCTGRLRDNCSEDSTGPPYSIGHGSPVGMMGMMGMERAPW